MVGKTLSHYEILAPLGAGGMGEVYRARDTNLRREVAIKVLPEDLAADADRLARLEREAHLLAALNHPNIATIHSFEEAEGVRFLVLELIKGESLEAKIARGPVPVSEALAVARQVAEALEAAHGQGIVHRDLKPANVLLTPEGRVKVLDFGLAKAVAPPPGSVDVSRSPTVTVGGTRTGVILGTAPYMSPEQVRGTDVDERTDIWAFGCLLYEMLAGRRLFDRDTVADTLAAILEAEPTWEALPPELPTTLESLLQRCLRKDTERRAHEMRDVRIEIEEAAGSSGSTAPMRVSRERVRSRREGRAVGPRAAVAAAVVATAAIAMWIVFTLSRPPNESALPQNPVALTFDGAAKSRPSLSANGEWIAYDWVGSEGDNRDVYVQRVGIGERWIRVTDNPGRDAGAVWSPDGELLAFVRVTDTETAIYTASSTGGNEKELIDVEYPAPNANSLTLSWSPDGRYLAYAQSSSPEEPGHIVVLDLDDPSRTPRPLTESQAFTAIDTEQSGDRHPRFDPEGARIAFLRSTAYYGGCDIWLMNADGSDPRPVTEQRWVRCSDLAWMPSGEELLVTAGSPQCEYTYRVSLSAGEPRLVPGMSINDVRPTVQGGRLVFVKAATATRDIYRLPGRLADDRGAPIRAAVATPAPDTNHSVSGDGRIAFESCLSGTLQVWIANLDGSGLQQITDMTTNAAAPSWSRDNRFIAFESNDSGNMDAWTIEVESRTLRQVTTDPGQDALPVFSHDDSKLYVSSDRSGSGFEIFAVPVEGEEPGGAEQMTRDTPREGAMHPFVDELGEFLYYADSVNYPRIWRASIRSVGAPELMVPEGPRFSPRWHLTPGGIYYEVRLPDGAGWAVDFLDLETGGITEIYRDVHDFHWLRVAPDEVDVTFTRSIGQSSWDLYLIENFR